ncbi:MAG: maleylacetoacetate isomerase [Burkholderiales bacterium]|nr:maleylacetoacetate isomerase [Burkholderiales bacterium]
MKLYNYFQSSASFRVRIALHLKGLSYDYLPVRLAKDEHKQPAFAAVSPEGLLPVLETDGGRRITQSMAIIEYLEETHPQPALLPADAVGRARVRALAQLIACEVHPLNNIRVRKYLLNDLKVGEEAQSAWYQHWTRLGFQAYEAQLAHQPGTFSHGNTPTLADCCLVPQVASAKRYKCDLNGLPRLMAVFDACMNLEAFQRAQPSAQPDADA